MTEWITATEAALYLKVKAGTVLRWAKQGHLKGYRLSGTRRCTWRFLRADLDATMTQPFAARTMVCADELLCVLTLWRQTTQFSQAEDWIFAGLQTRASTVELHVRVGEPRQRCSEGRNRSRQFSHVPTHSQNVVGFGRHAGWCAAEIDAAR